MALKNLKAHFKRLEVPNVWLFSTRCVAQERITEAKQEYRGSEDRR